MNTLERIKSNNNIIIIINQYSEELNYMEVCETVCQTAEVYSVRNKDWK